jgi:hypothetical protein
MITLVGSCRICKTEHKMQAKAKDVDSYRNGAHVQDAFPYLSAGERELLISGICGTCFDKILSEDDDQ